MRLLLTIIFISIYSNSHAHKDRIERPNTYRFIFENNDTVIFRDPKDPLINVYSEDIVKGKRHLVEAQLTFETGEILTLSHNGTSWSAIRIAHNNKVVYVPKMILQKIAEIHLQSIALLWDGNARSAFTANYFYIEFYLGTKKLFEKLPSLQLFFSGNEFTKATLWKQTSINSKRWSAY